MLCLDWVTAGLKFIWLDLCRAYYFLGWVWIDFQPDKTCSSQNPKHNSDFKHIVMLLVVTQKREIAATSGKNKVIQARSWTKERWLMLTLKHKTYKEKTVKGVEWYAFHDCDMHQILLIEQSVILIFKALPKTLNDTSHILQVLIFLFLL